MADRRGAPHDVVAQVLDYGSWVRELPRDEVIEIADNHLDRPFEAAFEETFSSVPPDEVNAELQLTIIATELDDASERIVGSLRRFRVSVNVVFFNYHEDEGRRYLSRSWLFTSE